MAFLFVMVFAQHRTEDAERDDAYGGSLQNRTRLLMEVVDTVTAVWSAERVGVRLSPLQPFNDMRDSSPEATFSYVVERLDDFELAYLHVTEMGRDAPGAAGPAFDLGRLRERWHGLYMTNYRYDKARANAALTTLVTRKRKAAATVAAPVSAGSGRASSTTGSSMRLTVWTARSWPPEIQ